MEMMEFEIHFAGRRKTLGRIKLGDFDEFFSVRVDRSPMAHTREWHRQLRSLLRRKRKIALPVWQHCAKVSRAWLFYRLGGQVFVQDRIFFRGIDLRRGRLPGRRTISDEGQRISEWSVSLGAIAAFLAK